MLVTLRNDFHKTETIIRTSDHLISLPQAYGAWRALCGSESCRCGNALGMRGRNDISVKPAPGDDGLSGYHFDAV